MVGVGTTEYRKERLCDEIEGLLTHGWGYDDFSDMRLEAEGRIINLGYIPSDSNIEYIALKQDLAKRERESSKNPFVGLRKNLMKNMGLILMAASAMGSNISNPYYPGDLKR